MALSAGTRVGLYEIVSAIGAGGMGEVYRARDTRLHRDVAIKVLPEIFACDPDRLARFEREAQLLAALNHPNIAHIHGLDDSTGVCALVMEFVEGPTIADRIARGPIPLCEAVPIAKQIADALEAAHDQGIIHRDLKPANIKVRADGTVKVLDFGLAKALDRPALSSIEAMNSPTLSVHATQAGILLGTAAYMAPEQARGNAADRRADIWAFGVVLFEMVTGHWLFQGETTTDTLASVLRTDVPLDALPSTTPPALRRLLIRCLKKDPKARMRDIGEARLELEELLIGAPEETDVPVIERVSTSWQLALWFAVGGALAAVVMLMFWAPWHKALPPGLLRLSAELGVDVPVSLSTDYGPAAILSPDGAVLAFVAEKVGGEGRQLYVRRLDQLRAASLSGTEAARDPFFSPDGRWLGFFAAGKLKKISVNGGAVVTVCDARSGRGGAWTEDDTITFSPDFGEVPLLRVSAAGGKPEPATTLDQGEMTQRWPQMLPGGKAVLYTSHGMISGFDDANLVVQPLPTGARKIVWKGGYHGRYVPSGHLVYLRDGTFFAAPFDLNRLEVAGPPVPALEGMSANPDTGGAQFAISGNGTVVYVPGSASNKAPLHWMNRDGQTTPIRAALAEWTNIVVAPDGRRLAMDIRDGQQWDVWVYEWARDTMARVTFDAADDIKPVWTPDGTRIAFASNRADRASSDLYWQRADGTGEVQRLTESRHAKAAGAWHPSGKFLAFFESHPQTNYDIMILPIHGDEATGWKPGKPTTFLNSRFMEVEPVFSRDGRWLAYMSNESGPTEVYVRPFPGPGGRTRVSIGGGFYPTWSRKRPELFYSSGDRIMVAPYSVEGDAFRPEKPRLWSERRFVPRGAASMRGYDLHPDGDRFALAAVAETQTSTRQDKVVFIFNFFDELRRIAPNVKR